MARYVITVDAADEEGLDKWLQGHSVLQLRSLGGSYSWRVTAIQRQGERPARPARPDPWTAGTTLVRLLADDSQHSAALSFGGIPDAPEG